MNILMPGIAPTGTRENFFPHTRSIQQDSKPCHTDTLYA
ncbi:hypothetical protein KL86DES1_20360 [uncultured Desulfovibrio sp.]|uniref:Uncharacterized protein n=1 Tax=uncultured Desulfovibrio sp. TaxID=167968 RepID=A0A212L3C5_9BACT|nr:hypothetical protein KL86DES1_20360 [uncultured Desulfovibrio sp.]